jgi:hypothetical protein
MASLKDVQATGKAFSPQKKTSRTSKNDEISLLFSIFVGTVIFALLDPDPDYESGSRIHNTGCDS